ncbi:hypothetical protein PIB30_002345 [Stylosanthes scabra]|uniref:POX domain-containing protein n=1 Tax=Stylosanthes scabra TaxID=79078 RepID=A0ABU6V1B4_9FABA|nr:hypothetical protein [Stylosanthes scabra]
MSHHQQDYHQHQQQAPGIYSFPNGFDRSTVTHQQPQIRREHNKAFDAPPPPLVGIDEEEEQPPAAAAGGGSLPHVYETAGMLSEMFSFPATELLEQQHHHHFRPPSSSSRPQPPENWYGSRQGMAATTQQQISSMNADSAAAMHLFLMNPPQRRSPSPPPSATSSTLHMLLPNHSSASLQGFAPPPPPPGSAGASFGQFTWIPDSGGGGHEGASNTPGGNVVEGQGLSLSLSSSLQHLEAAKAEELRMGDGGFLFYNQGGGSGGGGGPSSNSGNFAYNKNQQQLHLQGAAMVGVGQGHLSGFSSTSSSPSLGVVHVLRNSKYVKAAQELLEEFCSVGRGHFKKNKFSRQNSNPNSTASPSSSKDPPPSAPPPLSASDRIEHQRRKVKLLSMLDEVDRRYNHYCEQMQMVVNSFDVVMGYGAAVPYTALAQKAMSRHFRCLKDAITAQLKHSCEVLGEKDGAGGSGLTKGETPRLKMLEQSLRQQRAFQQMGMMEQEAWRPQRGLPERSVNILRAWLFEHFLHPKERFQDRGRGTESLVSLYTVMATSLSHVIFWSLSQVSNWFINARVRLWKPMVEEMYQQELKEAEECGGGGEDEEEDQEDEEKDNQQQQIGSTTAPPPPSSTNNNNGDESEIQVGEGFSENQEEGSNSMMVAQGGMAQPQPPQSQSQRSMASDDTCRHGSYVAGGEYGTASAAAAAAADIGSATLIRFGTTAGDVSLTLGLRHAGNVVNMPPRQNPFFS